MPWSVRFRSGPQHLHVPKPDKFDLDLRDWIGHRVLARRDQYFCPGVVRNVYEGYSVSILFDGEEQPLIYHEVLARGELDTVISDSVPASNQVINFQLQQVSEIHRTNVGNLKLGDIEVFCTADFWSSCAYESAEQKPKHCLTWDFLSALHMYSVKREPHILLLFRSKWAQKLPCRWTPTATSSSRASSTRRSTPLPSSSSSTCSSSRRRRRRRPRCSSSSRRG